MWPLKPRRRQREPFSFPAATSSARDALVIGWWRRGAALASDVRPSPGAPRTSGAGTSAATSSRTCCRESSDAEGLARVPRSSQPSDDDAFQPCWKCQNLALVVQIGDDKRELPFGATIPVFRCPPETPVTVSYYHRRDVNSAAALMLAASLWYGGMGTTLAASMVDRPSRIVILKGCPYSEVAKWGVLGTGFLAPRRQASGTG